MLILATISLTYNTETLVYAQEERLVNYGPIQFSAKIDLGMLIAAAALAATVLYNIIQMNKAEKNMMKQLDAQQRQMRNDKKISEAGFWLTLLDFLSRFDDVASFFRHGGKWGLSVAQLVYTQFALGKGPETPEEWTRVESYMSILQQFNLMIDQGVLSQQAFDKLYGERVDNIFYNDTVRTERLVLEWSTWKEFSRLCMKRKLHMPSRNIRHQTRWPPFFMYVDILNEPVIVGTEQSVWISVFDSLESLERDDEYPVPGAFVKMEVFYPSSEDYPLPKENVFYGSTDQGGQINFVWNIGKDSLMVKGKEKQDITNTAHISIEVSKEEKLMWRFTRSFKIKDNLDADST